MNKLALKCITDTKTSHFTLIYLFNVYVRSLNIDERAYICLFIVFIIIDSLMIICYLQQIF